MSKVIVTEVVGLIIVLFLMILFRPLVVGKVADAGNAYNITSTNTVTGVTSQSTITPTGAMTTGQADSLFSIALFILVIVGLVVIVLTATGKLHF